MINFKIKPLTKNQILISIDRLTRFKHPETKYLRVFREILLGNLIEPKFNKYELEKIDYKELTERAEEIINYSIQKENLTNFEANYDINRKLYNYEKQIFKIDENTEKLLNNKINYSACLNLIDSKSPKNLQWLKALDDKTDIEKIRYEKSLHFPIEKIIIAEGATEETLLPEFAKLCDYDFDKNGIHLIPAGGKNQVVKLFYELAHSVNIPIYVLLDKDGMENAEEIAPRLRSFDKIHIIKCGEFEDLLPETLVNRTINYEIQNISMLENKKDTKTPRVEFLEDVFKNRGMHEFKKAEFARMVKVNIQTVRDVSKEIKEIITEIKNLEKSTVDF